MSFRALKFSLLFLGLLTLLLAPARGDILLSEDFDDGAADAFTVQNGLWEVVDGEYVGYIEGSDVYGASQAGGEQWEDYQFECEVKVAGGVNQILRFRVAENHWAYEVNVRGEPYFDAYLYKWVAGNRFLIDDLNYFYNVAGDWHHWRIQALGNHLVVRFDEEEVFDYVDTNTPILAGGIQLIAFAGGVIQWQEAHYDNVLVTAITTAAGDGSWSELKALY